MQSTISYEAVAFEAALSRAHVDVVRIGAGHGPNSLVNFSFGGLEVLSGLIQFPVMGRATLSDDVIAVILIVEAPLGTRWCEIDLAPGDVLLYGPGAAHTALSPEGVEYRFALIDLSMLDDAAGQLGTPILRPARGSVTRFDPAPAVHALGTELLSFGSPLGLSDKPTSTSRGLVRATAKILTDPSPPLPARRSRRIPSRHVVNECIEYADTIERRPSIHEMCIEAHVSERRLRDAFYDVFDIPPHPYFRLRSLSHARDRLLDGEQLVTEVALDLGFEHLGRFARQYADLYGECPHETLAATRSRVSLRVRRPIADLAPNSLA